MATIDAIEGDSSPTTKTRSRGALVELPVLVIIAVLVAFVLKTFVGQAFFIPSESMYPQLKIDDRVLVSKLAYDFHDPNRGDIAVFPSPTPGPKEDDSPPVKFLHGLLEAVGLRQPAHEVLIKRVIALPGETVQGREGHVFINGRQLIEPYIAPDVPTDDFGPVTIPPGYVWMMGDNRTHSHDSRAFGARPISDLIGRAIVKVWPPGSASFL